MRCKQIVEIYETLIEQTKHKVGKNINIIYPKGSNNVVASDIEVTLKMVKSYEGRRDYWLGGKLNG